MPRPSKKPTRPGPKPGAANAGRPVGEQPPRVVLSCRVAMATLATLRRAGPHLGRTLDLMANEKVSDGGEK